MFRDECFGIHDVSLGTGLRRPELVSERQNGTHNESFPSFPPWVAVEMGPNMNFNVGNRLYGHVDLARDMDDSSRPPNGWADSDSGLQSLVSSYPSASNPQTTNRRPGNLPSGFKGLSQTSETYTMTSWSGVPDPP
jgi:hypothetical protein